MIKNIIFDFGKVLVDYDFLLFVDKIFDGEDEDDDKRVFSLLITCQDFVDECDLELIPFADLIKRKQAEYPRFAHKIQYFADHITDAVFQEKPGMRALMKRLKAAGYHLYGLSNWSSKVYDMMAKFPEIFALLEGSVISCEEHIIKPDPAIYHRLCEKYQLRVDECIFIDDKAVNIEGAQKAGLQAIHFKDTAQLERDLKRRIATPQRH